MARQRREPLPRAASLGAGLALARGRAYRDATAGKSSVDRTSRALRAALRVRWLALARRCPVAAAGAWNSRCSARYLALRRPCRARLYLLLPGARFMGGPRSSDLAGYAGATLNIPCPINATPCGGQPRHVGARSCQRGIETCAWA